MLQTIFEYTKDSLQLLLNYFITIDRRVGYLYLLTAALLAYYVFQTSVKQGTYWRYILNKKVWLGRSAKIDYTFFAFNSFIKTILIIPYLYFGFELAFYVQEFLIGKYGYPEVRIGITATIIWYTVVLTLVNDFFVYLVHLAFHKIPFLWEFHKVHHSATTMNPITQYRIHPIELIANNVQSTLVFGIVTGLFQYLSEGMVSNWTFLGVNVFTFLFFLFGANLRHSHVKLRYFPFVEYLFLSPMQHQIHHSIKITHRNKNMGSKLAVWDWIFGTLHTTKNVGNLTYGLGARQDTFYTTFWENMYRPFTNNFRRLGKTK